MKLKLINKKNEARDTKSFFWKGKDKISFLPGQYLYYTLSKLEFPDKRGPTRHFTISSSPTEGDLIELTTRIRKESGYKQTLDNLPVDSEIDASGPNGVFVFDKTYKDRINIFIAGGIGITPFRSFIKYVLDNKWTTKMYLIYSNSDSDYTFGKELVNWAKTNNNLKIEFVDTSKSGHLDNIKIKNIVDNWKLDIKDLLFWLAGPPPMVDSLETDLRKLKIPDENIISEKFAGY